MTASSTSITTVRAHAHTLTDYIYTILFTNQNTRRVFIVIARACVHFHCVAVALVQLHR